MTTTETDTETDIVRRVTFGAAQKNQKIPQLRPGHTVGVNIKVVEGGRERIQLFVGVVIKIQGSGEGRSFTVRKISSGVGVERTFPFTSPAIESVTIQSAAKVRRARLFYLRKLKGRAARLKSSLFTARKGVDGGATSSASAETHTNKHPSATAATAPNPSADSPSKDGSSSSTTEETSKN